MDTQYEIPNQRRKRLSSCVEALLFLSQVDPTFLLLQDMDPNFLNRSRYSMTHSQADPNSLFPTDLDLMVQGPNFQTDPIHNFPTFLDFTFHKSTLVFRMPWTCLTGCLGQASSPELTTDCCPSPPTSTHSKLTGIYILYELCEIGYRLGERPLNTALT